MQMQTSQIRADGTRNAEKNYVSAETRESPKAIPSPCTGGSCLLSSVGLLSLSVSGSGRELAKAEGAQRPEALIWAARQL
jgi:hypothetical protein